MKYTSRKRFLDTIKGVAVDRIPVMLWLNPHTTCRLIANYKKPPSKVAACMGNTIWKRFLRHGEMKADPITRALPLIMEEFGNAEYALELGSDIAILSPDYISPVNFITSIHREKDTILVDGAFGGKMALSGIYMHPIQPAVSSPSELRKFEFPQVSSKHFDGVRKFRKKHPHSCLLVEIGAMQQILCDYILGSESFMYALYDYPKELQYFMQKLEAWLHNIIYLASLAGTDIIFLQDDYGANHRPLISMDMWKRLTLPHLVRLIDSTHAHGLPFMLHSCGYQMPFLEHYVDIGLDILQSLQIGAGNDLQDAYDITGDKLTYATGIDVQLAENASPAKLSSIIQTAYDVGKQNGKFILGMTHMLQHSLTMEKYQVIFNTIRQLCN